MSKETIKKYLDALEKEREDAIKYLPEYDGWVRYLEGKIDAYKNMLEEMK